jgi:thymidylate synthase
MQQYQDLIRRILSDGHDVPDRTGTGTRSVFGHQMRFDLQKGFPLVTTKKTFWRGAFTEMLWILRGDTNIKWLQERQVYIWDEWANREGDLGPVYGAQWRDAGGSFDQLQTLIDGLRHNPHSRRHIITAWNPEALPYPDLAPHLQPAAGRMALAPCHCLVQFYVANGKLSCQLYQRSADVFLGVPFNIAGYALLTHLLAHHLGFEVGEFMWTGGDCHLYQNHLEQAQQVMGRVPLELPRLDLLHTPDTLLWEVEPSDLIIKDYHPHPPIKAPVSV